MNMPIDIRYTSCIQTVYRLYTYHVQRSKTLTISDAARAIRLIDYKMTAIGPANTALCIPAVHMDAHALYRQPEHAAYPHLALA